MEQYIVGYKKEFIAYVKSLETTNSYLSLYKSWHMWALHWIDSECCISTNCKSEHYDKVQQRYNSIEHIITVLSYENAKHKSKFIPKEYDIRQWAINQLKEKLNEKSL